MAISTAALLGGAAGALGSSAEAQRAMTPEEIALAQAHSARNAYSDPMYIEQFTMSIEQFKAAIQAQANASLQAMNGSNLQTKLARPPAWECRGCGAVNDGERCEYCRNPRLI